MRKLVLGGLSVLMLVALAWAGDAWKNKSYQQWDKADVQKILNDSPWAKVAHVDVPGANLGPQAGLPGGNSGSSGAAVKPGKGGGGGAPSTTPAELGTETGANLPQIPFVVRWVSSRTIREALVRSAELSGQLKEANAEKDLSMPVDMYEVMVLGPQMDIFEAAGESTLKENVLLTGKKTKEKIAPAKVDIQRTPDGKKILAILFSFPRQTANGEATIGSTEKAVEFSCARPPANFKVSFDIPKMEDSKGRDL